MEDRRHVRLADVAEAWWPLALSWMLMALEQPAIAGIVARLDDPEIHLAAYGSVVFPIALVIEAPIISLLSASTELSRDRASYLSLRRFTHRTGAILTLIHLLLAATPLFDLLVRGVLGVPDIVANEARIGMLLLLPWSWAIASRRTGQGVLIRYGYGRWVSVGTGIRLVVSVVVLGLGYVFRAPGVVTATAALSTGVLAEAAVVGAVVARVRPRHLGQDDPERTPLRGRAFREFYVPLALMPVVALVIQPVGTSAISRMPQVVESLALWPVLVGLAFFFQALGISFNEVVVALIGRPGARRALKRFTLWLIVLTVTLPSLLAFTPLSAPWFGTVIGLDAKLTHMATLALMIAVPIPATRVLQSWYQGLLVARRQTRGISEAVFVFAVVCTGVMAIGVVMQSIAGLYVALAGFAIGRFAQTIWLAYRARQLSPLDE